jgi:fatty acid desaturase
MSTGRNAYFFKLGGGNSLADGVTMPSHLSELVLEAGKLESGHGTRRSDRRGEEKYVSDNAKAQGVYDWEGGQSGIKRKAAPEWYVPRIDRKELRALMKRNNFRGFLNVGLWIVLMGALGYLSAVTMSSPWCILLFFLYGQLLGNSSARWHECLHGTPFSTPVLNEIVFFFACAIDFRDIIFTRWSHVTHHSYTIDTEVDLEIAVPRPAKLWKLLADLLYITSGIFFIRLLMCHSLGVPSKAARRVVPENDFPRMFWAARSVLAIHLAVIALAVALHNWLPILLFSVPRFYGAALMLFFTLTQHAGLAENSNDHRLVARTIIVNPVFSFLYMHMQYHVEHHIFPNVPFHALGKLHKAVRGQMPVPYQGMWEAYREIIPTLLRQRHDASYFVKRQLPADN